MSVSKEKKFFACVAIDNVDMRLLNFAIEYLHKNETVFTCSYEAQVESLSKKIGENLVTLSIYSTSSILSFFLPLPSCLAYFPGKN